MVKKITRKPVSKKSVKGVRKVIVKKPMAKVVGVKKSAGVKKVARPLVLQRKIQTGTGWKRAMAKKKK